MVWPPSRLAHDLSQIDVCYWGEPGRDANMPVCRILTQAVAQASAQLAREKEEAAARELALEAERKAARDARYAARKKRK